MAKGSGLCLSKKDPCFISSQKFDDLQNGTSDTHTRIEGLQASQSLSYHHCIEYNIKSALPGHQSVPPSRFKYEGKEETIKAISRIVALRMLQMSKKYEQECTD